MAEPTSPPSLPSTADATPYVPVSWAAAGAAAVAGVFLVTLLLFGYFAFVNKKPLLMEELLVLPAVAMVLCFAARRMIRNSEGTRTDLLYGVNLVNTAWWLSLVLGLCYIAYLFAIDFAIRRDARTEVKKWGDQINRGTEDDLDAAFLRTVAPGQRQSISATDKYQLRSRFRDELLIFRTCDLLKIAQRNKGELELTPDAVTWMYRPGTIECLLTGAVKCPEGTFPITVSLKGTEGVTGGEGGGGRAWQIVRAPGSGFINQGRATRTPYGWLVARLEADGAMFGKTFVVHLMPGRTAHTYAYRAFVAPGGDRESWSGVAIDRDPLWTTVSHLAFAAPARVGLGDAGYAEYMDKHFFKAPGGAEPSSAQKGQFLASWNAQGLRPAGDRLKDGSGNAIDKEDVLTFNETAAEPAIEVRVPVEIPLLEPGKIQTARGRLVVACTDRAVLAELKQLKASANPAQGTSSMPDELAQRRFKWRVIRIESDMLPVVMDRGPPPPGMPPG